MVIQLESYLINSLDQWQNVYVTAVHLIKKTAHGLL